MKISDYYLKLIINKMKTVRVQSLINEFFAEAFTLKY